MSADKYPSIFSRQMEAIVYRMFKVVRKAFNIVEVGNLVCCHGNKNCKLILQSTSS